MTRAAELSNIFKKIGDALYQAADELNALGADVAVNDSAAPVSPPRPAAADSLPAAPASFSDGIPVEEPPVWTDPIPAELDIPTGTPRNSAQDEVLGECPVHFRAWTVREGGISKNGKPYSAFWKCSGKNDDGSYCNKKPLPGWVKTHDPEKALAAQAA